MPISIGPKRTASSISGFTALLHDGHRITVVAGHRQIGFDEQGVVRLETEIQVLRTDQTADRDDRRGDQHGADRNLHDEQRVADPKSAISFPFSRHGKCWQNGILPEARSDDVLARDSLEP